MDVRKGNETKSTLNHYLGAVGDADKAGITRLDLDTDTYNTFMGNVSDWAPATAYDTPLIIHYGGKYNLRAVLRREWEKVDNASDLIKPKIDNTGLIHPEKDNNGIYQYETLTSSIGNYFVSTHYGDWPSPEVFFKNTKENP